MRLQSSFFLLLLSSFFDSLKGIPLSQTIEKGSVECIYDSVHAHEFITTSIFVSDGDSLKVRTMVQGPITHYDVSSSAEILAAAMRLDKLGKDKKDLFLNRHTDLDFETLYDETVEDDDEGDKLDASIEALMDDMDDERFQDYYYMDDDDEYERMVDDAMTPEEVEEVKNKQKVFESMSEEEKKQHKAKKMEEKRAKLEAFKKRREEKHRLIEAHRQKKADAKKENRLPKIETGTPVENTFEIHEDGWYRFCVEATDATVEAELEMRKSSELGSPSKSTGHVPTWDSHDMTSQEKKLMEKLTSASKEEGVKEEDLSKTKSQVLKMNRLLNEIKEKQTQEKHRLSLHKTMNEHSHYRMVTGSLFETFFYIAVSGYQVYTIRKWFSSNHGVFGY